MTKNDTIDHDCDKSMKLGIDEVHKNTNQMRYGVIEKNDDVIKILMTSFFYREKYFCPFFQKNFALSVELNSLIKKCIETIY